MSKILGLFGNTLTADQMYSRHRWEKFPEQVQTMLSQKPKPFAGNFIGILGSTENTGNFEKKDRLFRLNISEVIDPEKYSYFNARKFLF